VIIPQVESHGLWAKYIPVFAIKPFAVKVLLAHSTENSVRVFYNCCLARMAAFGVHGVFRTNSPWMLRGYPMSILVSF
jgi:hypothetical protein